ncbi:MAG: transposase [Nitrospira sp.]|nr:MAG: transposase [Nitrospira sp.]
MDPVCRRSRTIQVGQSPQQNGRVERFIGTVKRKLATESIRTSER